MKTLYFDCGMGAAGDMLMASLYEICPDKEKFLKMMNGMGIPGISVEAEPSVKCGITGTHMKVTIHGEEEESVDVDLQGHEHHHDHDEDHHHTHDHEDSHHTHDHHHDHEGDHHDHSHEAHHHSHELAELAAEQTIHEHTHPHDHDHDCGHDHTHDHGHTHHHHATSFKSYPYFSIQIGHSIHLFFKTFKIRAHVFKQIKLAYLFHISIKSAHNQNLPPNTP